jgi:hypothetical protein
LLVVVIGLVVIVLVVLEFFHLHGKRTKVYRWLLAFVPMFGLHAMFFAGFGTSPCREGAAEILSRY